MLHNNLCKKKKKTNSNEAWKYVLKIQLETRQSILNEDVYTAANCHRSTA